MVNRRGRAITGVILLDKPSEISSNAALQRVKRLFNAAKAGHTGSLDPLATGMLPICFGEATKFSQFLLNADKTYTAVVKLGITTTTGDSEGEITATANKEQIQAISEQQLAVVIQQFVGAIDQIPSMYSALKYQGKPLYKLARQGIEVERSVRQVHIYTLTYQRLALDQLVIHVHCSKGTYIRTLVEDIGRKLGCGAHLIALRRLSVDRYQPDQMYTLQQLEELAASEGESGLDNCLLPIESMLQDWSVAHLTPTTFYYLQRGQAVTIPGAFAQGWVRLQLPDGTFVGVGEILEDGRLAPRRLIRSQGC